MTQPKNIRAYVSSRDEASQKLIIRDHVGDADVAWYGPGIKDREQWLRQLRADEAAIVARLDCIAGQRSDGIARPSVDFTMTLHRLLGACAYVIDAEAGVTSQDGSAWTARLEWAANQVLSRRRMKNGEAKAMAKKRWAKVKPKDRGAVTRWISRAKRDERDRWAQHWRDPQYPSALAAYEAMPPEVRAEIGSLANARRVFGPRRPGDKRAGGRPRNKR